MTEIETISDIVCDIKENITDIQYKTIMECLLELNKKKTDDEIELTRDFFKQYFYHSPKNNNCYYYMYVSQDNSLWLSFEYKSHRLYVNNEFLYSKTFNCADNSINLTYAKILKIMPKYCLIEVDNYQKKVSNKTLTKILYFPYINIF